MDRLKGKIAVVTGGGSGIGGAIAALFTKEGATVCVFDLKGEGENFYKTDVSDEAQVAENIKKVAERFGRIDVLVNNAGITGENTSTHNGDAGDWKKVFDVNVMGIFNCVKHVVPVMAAGGGGSIINMASVYATCGSKGDLSAYHASKGAVVAMTKQDAVTYGGKHIRVNCILHGAIVTDMIKKFSDCFEGGFEGYVKYASKRHPIGYLGEPDDIAYGAVYLASDESKFVTGLMMYIDGGYSAW